MIYNAHVLLYTNSNTRYLGMSRGPRRITWKDWRGCLRPVTRRKTQLWMSQSSYSSCWQIWQILFPRCRCFHVSTHKLRLNDLSPNASSTLAIVIVKLQRTCAGRARIETSSESLAQHRSLMVAANSWKKWRSPKTFPMKWFYHGLFSSHMLQTYIYLPTCGWFLGQTVVNIL